MDADHPLKGVNFPRRFTQPTGNEALPLCCDALVPNHDRPDAAAGVVAFLASPAAAYIAGETVIISGGWVID